VRRALILLVALLIGVTTGGLAWLVVRDGSTPSASGPGDRPAVTFSPTPRPTDLPAPPRALRHYYTQKLDWQSCPDHTDYQCATMQVPLDYAKPGGEEIGIWVLRVPAREQGRKVGALVVNPGGPGAPGTTGYADSPGTYWRNPITDRFDIVGFDPRGTGRSHPVDCLDDKSFDTYLASDPDPDTPQEVADFQRLSRELGAGCESRSGEFASHVSTVEAARDLDVLRAVLGEKQLDYFGASYGTELGATYARLFPTHVGRFVLDGAVDTSVGPVPQALAQARGFETALHAYVANCVSLGNCFLGGTVDAGLKRIRDFLAGLDQHPLPAGDRRLTESLGDVGVFAPLYNRDYWIYLSAALKQAFNGDGSVLLLIADAYATRTPNGRYTTNLLEANAVISCLDHPFVFPASRVASLVPRFEKASPTFGRGAAWSLTRCNDFTTRAEEPEPETDAAGAPPILVIGTSRDPATPYSWAVALAKQLSSAVLVTRDGDGHTGYNAGNSCVDTTVEDYLLDGKVPSTDVNCPAP
jgi:pimeloyl-ACP methyl ester carboxylesterase